MIGYGNVETRIIEADYPTNESLASLASNEESGELFLSGRRSSSNTESRDQLHLQGSRDGTKNGR